jgi:hypothetical protein
MQPLSAAVHYVSPGGTATWEQSTDITKPCALSVSNANALAKDTVYLRGGLYSGNGDMTIRPGNSGTSEDNRIVFSNYNNEEVNFEESRGIYIEKKSYITVNGINFKNMKRFLLIYGSHHITVSHCNFDGRHADASSWQGALIMYSYNDPAGERVHSTHNWIHHCTFHRWAYNAADAHDGDLMDIGSGQSAEDSSSYNLIEDNVFAYGGHHTIGVYSRYNVIRNNYSHNELNPDNWDFEGFRAATTEGPNAGFCLWEGNRFGFAGQPEPDAGGSGMTFRSSHNIFRFNAVYHTVSGGIQTVCNLNNATNEIDHADYNRIYNNTFYHNGYELAYAGHQGGIYFARWSGVSPVGNVVKNNIFYDNNANASHCSDDGSICYAGDIDSQIIENNWNNIEDPLFINQSNNGPDDPGLPDFHLQKNSHCIDSGAFITKITRASGSGSQFQVEDAGYFMDGWGIIEGDEIQLEDSSQRARITEVDYDNNIITVDKGLSWTQNMGISLAYWGSAPDLGAHEYTGVVNIENSNYNNNTINPQIMIYPNPSRGKFLIQLRNISLALMAGSKLQIYDLSGRLVDELKLQNEKFFWNNNSVTNGTYLMRLEGTNKHLSKKLLLIR